VDIIFPAALNLAASGPTHHGASRVFFTFMPLGAAIGGLGGAFLFGVIAIRDAEIAIEREPVRRRER